MCCIRDNILNNNMKIKIINSANIDLTQIEPLLKDLLVSIKQKLNLETLPAIKFVSDPKNSQNPLGQTAHYEQGKNLVSVFTDARHPKDILRSISHEMIHFCQDLRGDLSNMTTNSPGYAQEDGHLRKMEEEAYLKGNMIFRDWEDAYKSKNNLRESKMIYETRKRGNPQAVSPQIQGPLSNQQLFEKIYGTVEKFLNKEYRFEYGTIQHNPKPMIEGLAKLVSSQKNIDHTLHQHLLVEFSNLGRALNEDGWDEPITSISESKLTRQCLGRIKNLLIPSSNPLMSETIYSKKSKGTQVMSKNKIEVSDIDGIFKTHREGSVQNLMEHWGYVTKEGKTFLMENYDLVPPKKKEIFGKKEEEPTEGEKSWNVKRKRPWEKKSGKKKEDIKYDKKNWAKKDDMDDEQSLDESAEELEENLDEALAPMNTTSYETTAERRVNGKSDTDDCSCQDKPLPSTVEAKQAKLDQKKLDEVMKRVLARVMKEVRGTASKKKV